MLLYSILESRQLIFRYGYNEHWRLRFAWASLVVLSEAVESPRLYTGSVHAFFCTEDVGI